jgi:hypothetical protein
MDEVTERRTDTRMRVTLLRMSLVLAHVLFLWMYLSAESLERMARQGLVAGPAGMDIVRVADQYAAAWRHGMAGNSWLYLPGFFLAAVSTWMWSLGRRLPSLAIEAVVLLTAAWAIAALLSPLGASSSLASFENAAGVHRMGAPPGFTVDGASLALYTIATWDVATICCQLSIARRSLRLMWIPIPLNIVLANVRPWTVSDFTSQWAADLADGKGAAVLSAAAVPLVAAFLVLYQLRPDGTPRPASTGG